MGILQWLERTRAGDFASIIGVLISLVGFVITIRAANAAREAAHAALDRVQKFESIVDLSAVITILEELKRVHRQENWAILPDRYAATRKQLIALREAASDSKESLNKILQKAIVNLKIAENIVEKHLHNKTKRPNVAEFNSIISDDIDDLITMLSTLKSINTRN